MALYNRKPTKAVEALTFDEFVEFGRQNAVSMVNNVPWNFIYNNLPVTHSNDECYLIPSLIAGDFYEMTPNDMIIIHDNHVVVMPVDFFTTIYEKQ